MATIAEINAQLAQLQRNAEQALAQIKANRNNPARRQAAADSLERTRAQAQALVSMRNAQAAAENPAPATEEDTTEEDATTGTGTGTGRSIQDQRDVLDEIRDFLIRNDLPVALADRAWTEIVNGRSAAGIILAMQEWPEVQERFKGNELRRKNGLPVLPYAEYLATEAAIRSINRQFNLPTGFFDSRDDFAQLIGGDVSPAEYRDRIEPTAAVVAENRTSVRQQLRDLYGIEPDDGALLAYALDRTRGTELIRRQLRAAQIAGGASEAGLAVTRERAEQLAATGLNAQQAASGFSAIGQTLDAQRFQAGAQEPALTQADLEQEVFEGNADVARRRRKREQESTALFEGSGGALASQSGVGALGTVRR